MFTVSTETADQTDFSPGSIHGIRPAVTRSATDVVSPWLQIIEFNSKRCLAYTGTWTRPDSGRAGTTVTAKDSTAPAGAKPWQLLNRSWATETLSHIRSFYGKLKGWNGENASAPEVSALNSAELLTALFDQYGEDLQIKFAVDSDGLPTFATLVDGFYLHLTIDNQNHITWLAELNGSDHFEAEVPFSGEALPDSLRRLLAAAT